MNQKTKEVRHGCFLSVVHPVPDLLAIGPACAGPVSAGLAVPAAVPASRDRGRRSFEAGVGGGDATGKAAGGAVSGVMVTGQNCRPSY
jgi:hypothetical protein